MTANQQALQTLIEANRADALYYEQNYFDYGRDATAFVNRHQSAATRRTYARYIKEFFDYHSMKHPARITISDVQTWFKWQAKTKSPNTLRTKLSCLRSFFDQLKYFGIIEINPASVKAIAPPKVADAPSGIALAPGQVKLLLSLPDQRTVIGARDYALMLLMLRTFMRVAEAVSLREGDFYYQKTQLYVRVKIKGGEIHHTPIPREVKTAIEDYHFLDAAHRSLIKTKEGESKFVFMPTMAKKTRTDAVANTHISDRHARHIVAQYGEKLFLKENLERKKEAKENGATLGDILTLSPHDFRRTAITRSLDLGESYRRVQNGARIKSIATVQRYDHHRQALEENSILTLNYDEE